ncbi:GNAT family N-acetyltransferase [Nocardioides sp. LHG3406-4]|uniref:GNAT family N-acetyltransferase n=1 Tax=Nocardioides sp. LHG3406-4 TaxID=2804575 RepID=UPI003CFB66B8
MTNPTTGQPAIPADVPAGVMIRPMTPADVPAAEHLSAEAFLEVARAHAPRGAAEPRLRSRARADLWVTRTLRFLESDAAGCWVAEGGGELLGFATSYRRDTTWFLATYAVRPGIQGRGLGKALLATALDHSRGALRGMLSSSDDPRAFRRYRLAGFDLHPQMFLSGEVDRSAVPFVERVREATRGDIDLMNSVDRATRGAAHGSDHEFLFAHHRAIVVDHRTGEGYAYFDDRGVALLAASNRRTATSLLWAALAEAEGETSVPHVTAANQWAIDVGLAAGLSLRTQGYLGVRGMKPPTPYIHHGSLL